MWLLYLFLIRQALIDFYYLITESFRWAFAGGALPDFPVLSGIHHTLQDYGVVILANGVILIVWALYNQIRFRGPDRRRTPKPVSVEDLAKLYQRPAEDIAAWQSSRILVMVHALDGTLVRVISKDDYNPSKLPRETVHSKNLRAERA